MVVRGNEGGGSVFGLTPEHIFKTTGGIPSGPRCLEELDWSFWQLSQEKNMVRDLRGRLSS